MLIDLKAVDQAALLGLLNNLYNLGLVILNVQSMPLSIEGKEKLDSRKIR